MWSLDSVDCSEEITWLIQQTRQCISATCCGMQRGVMRHLVNHCHPLYLTLSPAVLTCSCWWIQILLDKRVRLTYAHLSFTIIQVCDWAALFRTTLLTLLHGVGARKGALNIVLFSRGSISPSCNFLLSDNCYMKTSCKSSPSSRCPRQMLSNIGMPWRTLFTPLLYTISAKTCTNTRIGSMRTTLQSKALGW